MMVINLEFYQPYICLNSIPAQGGVLDTALCDKVCQ